MERINHSDHKSRSFGKVSFLTKNHGHLPTYNSQKILSTCFRLIFIFWVSLSFYDMQSEICSPHTMILNISGEGGGHQGGHFFTFTIKKVPIFQKEKKNRIVKHGHCSDI